ncbi:MAG: hypothetical protein RIQ72_651 [Candidatus Parcubacteria bacterium]|jgi:hypothetical protein
MLQILGIVLLASIIRFAVGGLWYMPKGVLGKAWMKSQDYTPTDAQKMMGKKAMVSGFIFTFVSTFILALMLAPLAQMSGVIAVSPIVPALILVGLIWVGFIVPILAQRKIYNVHGGYSWKTFFIDAGHEFVALAIATAVLVWFM